MDAAVEITPGDRVRHKHRGWIGRAVEEILLGTSMLGDKLFNWRVEWDKGTPLEKQLYFASELEVLTSTPVLCNKSVEPSAVLLHKKDPPPSVLCNKTLGKSTQLLHKIIAEIESLSRPQLHELQRHILQILDNEPELEAPLKKGRELVDRIRVGSIVYQSEKVKCGKAQCRSCPHGPYWYAYFRRDGKLRSKYVGIELKSVA